MYTILKISRSSMIYHPIKLNVKNYVPLTEVLGTADRLLRRASPTKPEILDVNNYNPRLSYLLCHI